MIALVALLSALGVWGIALVVLPPRDDGGVVQVRVDRTELLIQFIAAITLAGLVLVASQWVIPALVVGVGAFWVVGVWLRRRKSGEAEIARLDALASWIENVRDVLMAGEQPIGAISSTVGACQPVIRPHVRRLAAALGSQGPDIAFRRFADDLDDPLADLVAAGLAIAIRRGARTVPVLTALADQTRQQVDRRRLIEAERVPARREVQALTLIMGALIIALLVFGRSSYLDVYDHPGGQLFLTACLAGYAALIVRVQRLAAFPRPARFLTSESSILEGGR